MIINNVSQELRKIKLENSYEPVKTSIGSEEIPVGSMNNEEKSIILFLDRTDDERTILYLKDRLNNSLRRFGSERYFCRQGEVVVTHLNLSRLIWRPYTPNLN